MEHIHLSLIVTIFFRFFILAWFPTVRYDQHEPRLIKLPSDSQQQPQQQRRLKEEEVCPIKSPVHVMSCPVNCFRPDPVCGVNGVTYWCGCREAHCAGVKVAKLGFCEVGNGGAAPISAQALLLVHIVWLIVLGSVLFGLF